MEQTSASRCTGSSSGQEYRLPNEAGSFEDERSLDPLEREEISPKR